jgi:CRISPR system Cascade subunit CasE
MYLARGVLNPASRDVQRDLSDAAHLHRTILKCFPNHVGGSPRKTLGVLYRVDENRRGAELVLFVQSASGPDFTHLPSGYFVSPTDDLDLALQGDDGNPRIRFLGQERAAIAVGDRLVFRLQANATRKILTKSLADGTKQNGKRVPVRGDEARLDWLRRHAEAAGFAVADVRVSEVAKRTGMRGAARLTLAGALFEGVLLVRDADLFRKALESGIGPAKAYGYGLLSIHRAG